MIEPAFAAGEDLSAAARIAEWGWAWIVTPLLGLIGALFVLVRSNDMRRVEDLGKQVDKIDEELVSKFDNITETLRTDRELYHALNLISAQTKDRVERLVSHAESEVRTRAESNRMLREQSKMMMDQNQQIIEEIRKLTSEMSRRAEQKSRRGDAN